MRSGSVKHNCSTSEKNDGGGQGKQHSSIVTSGPRNNPLVINLIRSGRWISWWMCLEKAERASLGLSSTPLDSSTPAASRPQSDDRCNNFCRCIVFVLMVTWLEAPPLCTLVHYTPVNRPIRCAYASRPSSMPVILVGIGILSILLTDIGLFKDNGYNVINIYQLFLLSRNIAMKMIEINSFRS
jgi:hypothetical protein